MKLVSLNVVLPLPFLNTHQLINFKVDHSLTKNENIARKNKCFCKNLTKKKKEKKAPLFSCIVL